MTNVKIQISNQAKNQNVKDTGSLTLNHLALIWHLSFVIWISYARNSST